MIMPILIAFSIMEIEGKVWEEGKLWMVEIPSLDAMTQGKTRKDALEMAEDLVLEMMRSYFKDEIGKSLKITIVDPKEDVIAIATNETELVQSLSLRRQREVKTELPKQSIACT